MKGLFVGLSTVDLQFLVPAYPPENSKVKAHDNTIATGGPATNAAIVYQWLGANATLCTPVGEHVMKDMIVEDLRKWNLNLVDPIQGKPAEPVYASIITTEESAHRTVYSYHPPPNNHAFNIPGDLYEQSYRTVLADGFYLPLMKDLLQNGLRYDTLILDGGSWKDNMDELLVHVDIAVCSAHFFPPGCETSYDVFTYLQSFGIEEIVITRGHEPVLWHTADGIHEIPVAAVHAMDTLGAGDFFHGAFCYFYAATQDVHKSIRQSAQIAALSCKHFGTRTWLEVEAPVTPHAFKP